MQLATAPTVICIQQATVDLAFVLEGSGKLWQPTLGTATRSRYRLFGGVINCRFKPVHS